ncbi:serine/threonine protein phosphatase regulatory subunit [Acrasis kona]|uniref:Serine/threonine protein phosphatase regulatory subunit n=1 Tax=Acrasis kona TaxID=1008807 RepID=A0AAW2ZMI6_9EUKA
MKQSHTKAYVNETFKHWLSLKTTQDDVNQYIIMQQQTIDEKEKMIKEGSINLVRRSLSPIKTNPTTLPNSPKSPLSPRLAVDEVDVTTNNMQHKLNLSHQQQHLKIPSPNTLTPQTPPRSPSSNRNHFSFDPKSPSSASPNAKKKLEFWDPEMHTDQENEDHDRVLFETEGLEGKKKRVKLAQESVTVLSMPNEEQQQPMKPNISVESLIPRFYFPTSGEIVKTPKDLKQDLLKIKEVFMQSFGGLNIDEFKTITVDFCGLPYYLTPILFQKLDQNNTGKVTGEVFEKFWRSEMFNKTETERIFQTLKQPSSQHLTPNDFKPMMRELLLTHPGLKFLKATPAFQEKYAETVIVRIFYTLNGKGTGRINYREFKNSSLVDSMRFIHQDEDVNQELNFFSYEHFYVIYCKFWELDTDHDFMIEKDDLLRYSESSLTERVAEILINTRMVPGNTIPRGKMGYQDFIWFCLSEEDKTTATSLEYWFRLVDIDGDGIISDYELEYFFCQIRERMLQIDATPVLFDDVRTQIIDMLKPQNNVYITLRDIKSSKMSPIFFNILTNLNKFFLFEQKGTVGNLTTWASYARQEYDRMAAEDDEEEYFEDANEDGDIAMDDNALRN